MAIQGHDIRESGLSISSLSASQPTIESRRWLPSWIDRCQLVEGEDLA